MRKKTRPTFLFGTFKIANFNSFAGLENQVKMWLVGKVMS
jgi:hypothetical protein